VSVEDDSRLVVRNQKPGEGIQSISKVIDCFLSHIMLQGSVVNGINLCIARNKIFSE
jgi:hypothetical protein